MPSNEKMKVISSSSSATVADCLRRFACSLVRLRSRCEIAPGHQVRQVESGHHLVRRYPTIAGCRHFLVIEIIFRMTSDYDNLVAMFPHARAEVFAKPAAWRGRRFASTDRRGRWRFADGRRGRDVPGWQADRGCRPTDFRIRTAKYILSTGRLQQLGARSHPAA